MGNEVALAVVVTMAMEEDVDVDDGGKWSCRGRRRRLRGRQLATRDRLASVVWTEC